MFKEQYNYYLNLVEKYLESLPLEESLLCRSMSYSLSGGGKRLRPVLALACVELVGGRPEEFVREAAALELIHTYSLIHDDLPSMDDADYRRGKLANHKVFGEAIAILTGDALLTMAFELLAQPLPIPAERQLRVIREVASAAGYKGMVGGQVLDTFNSQETNSVSDIEKIHNLKTGALLIAAARLGAILGGGTETEIEIVTRYAADIGLAFQIRDDILDVIGDSAILGKPNGSDERLNKTTFPYLLGLEGANTKLQETIDSAKKAIQTFGAKAAFLKSLADFIAERKH